MNRIVSIIGLGYVGLPLAVAFGSKGKTIAYDNNRQRVNELCYGKDCTGEVKSSDLINDNILFSYNSEDLKSADFHIIAVPTPVDTANQPDLSPLFTASKTVGNILKRGDVVVYESTVYPGATEEECIPILELASGLKSGRDFKVGYSPERINPGDREHSFTKIIKVVSGQDNEALEIVAQVYESVVTAGVYRAESIKIAEAAKIIENTQRDLNIALMNELSIIFDQLGIDTSRVLATAATKWNFLKFKPGLVGGHCIGVDPYYLTHKAEKIGYIPQVILAGRRINDGMGRHIAQRTIKEMIRAGHNVFGSTVTILGLTFKENCPDIRNSKVYDIIYELKDYGVNVQVHDPLADPREAKHAYNINLLEWDKLGKSEVVMVAVAHQIFCQLSVSELSSIMSEPPVLIDIKAIYDLDAILSAGIRVWRL